jgi:hypothetical protein
MVVVRAVAMVARAVMMVMVRAVTMLVEVTRGRLLLLVRVLLIQIVRLAR